MYLVGVDLELRRLVLLDDSFGGSHGDGLLVEEESKREALTFAG